MPARNEVMRVMHSPSLLRAVVVLSVGFPCLNACSGLGPRRPRMAQEREYAREFLQIATSTAAVIDTPDLATRAHSAIARALTKVGDTTAGQEAFRSAKRSADRIGVPQDAAWSRLVVARAQAAAGDLVGAARTAEGIGYPEPQGAAYLAIAMAMAAAGKTAAAEQIIDRIDLPKIKAQAYLSVARSLSRRGKLRKAKGLLDEATEAADTIEPLGIRAAVYVNLVTAQAEAGESDRAKATADDIADVDKRCLAYVGLAAVRLQAADRATARDLLRAAQAMAKRVDDRGLRALLYRVIAAAQAKAGQCADARRTAEEIEDSESRALAYWAIAASTAEASDTSRAKAIADDIGDAYAQSRAYLAIARVHARTGKTVKFRNCLEAARVTADGMQDARVRADLLTNIVEVQAQAGGFEDAMGTAARIDDAESRIRAFLHIAKAQAAVDCCESAKKLFGKCRSLAYRIDDHTERETTLVAIVEVLSRAAEQVWFRLAPNRATNVPGTSREDNSLP